jgi:GrpB-like predicted nucleotidyltransferase (UPF0157 family)
MTAEHSHEKTAKAVKDAPVKLEPYSGDWPALFAAEAAQLQAALAPWLVGVIEHIGSTAVPGLSAKPVIDIMAPVHSLAHAAPAIDALAALNYGYFPYKPTEMLWFCKPSPAHRTHHLHLVPAASPLWQQRLAFRDALRRDAALASEYERLKVRLAAAHALDREAYTEGKTAFIHRVLQRVARGAG